MDPYILTVSKDMQEYLDLNESKLQVKFTPAESETAMMGGNSNWRGPIWLCSMYNSAVLLLQLTWLDSYIYYSKSDWVLLLIIEDLIGCFCSL